MSHSLGFTLPLYTHGLLALITEGARTPAYDEGATGRGWRS
jgi:hypothetical protein